MIKVDYLPTREQLEYVVELAKKKSFPSSTENALSFILHFRNGRYHEWLNFQANDEKWLQFQPLRDSRGCELRISYDEVKLVSLHANSTIYSMTLSWKNSNERVWIVNHILEMVNNPTLYLDEIKKVASWQKFRKIKEQTSSDLINNTLKDLSVTNLSMHFPHYKKGDFGDNGNMDINFHSQGIGFSFNFAERLLPVFISNIPSIISEAVQVQKKKRGRLDY